MCPFLFIPPSQNCPTGESADEILRLFIENQLPEEVYVNDVNVHDGKAILTMSDDLSGTATISIT